MNDPCSVPIVALTWHVGDVIRKMRGRESQAAFGRRSRTSRPTINRIETKGEGYNDATLAGIATALGLTTAELLAAVPVTVSVEFRATLERFWLLDPRTTGRYHGGSWKCPETPANVRTSVRGTRTRLRPELAENAYVLRE